jgi:hypothetical protein
MSRPDAGAGASVEKLVTDFPKILRFIKMPERQLRQSEAISP